jgi:hypothetical protein
MFLIHEQLSSVCVLSLYINNSREMSLSEVIVV